MADEEKPAALPAPKYLTSDSVAAEFLTRATSELGQAFEAALKALPKKRRRFVREYLIDQNATAAYKRAGGKAEGHSAEVIGSRWLRQVEVVQAIALGEAQLANKTGMTATWVLEKLRELYEKALEQQPVFGKEGEIGAEWKTGAVAAKALELIGKHLGAFVERVDHTTKGKELPADTRPKQVMLFNNQRIEFE